jgi:hypothetical protein
VLAKVFATSYPLADIVLIASLLILTPGGNSERLAGLLQVRQGDETGQFDLKLSGGQVVVPVVPGACEVDITFADAGAAMPVDRLL